jgi:hypothetical protein
MLQQYQDISVYYYENTFIDNNRHFLPFGRAHIAGWVG